MEAPVTAWGARWCADGVGAGRRLVLALLALVLAAATWLPLVHLLYTPRLADFWARDGIPPLTRLIANRHLALWTEPALLAAELARMRGSNPEWDFMGRTFLGLALANMARRDPASAAGYLAVLDRILEATLTVEREQGNLHFLMSYAVGSPFSASPARSLFVDGEIALMLAARQFVAADERWRQPLAERIDRVTASIASAPCLMAESYPDECWTFDHAVGLAATQISDLLDGRDHGPLRRAWLAHVRRTLLEERTGLLYACCTYKGERRDGPEGTTLWLAAHCLQLLDPAFAADQYARAKRELARDFYGLGYAREWPPGWAGAEDVDSGPIIPGLELSAGSTGLAFLGAASFADAEFLGKLLANLQFGAFPKADGDRLKYCGSNQVGDAVLLYALVQGPLWREVQGRTAGGTP